MVQERDAALKRQAQRRQWDIQRKKELEENTIKFRWAVIEHTPKQTGWGYYDTDTPAKDVVVADDFETEMEAVEWMDAHEPDKGKSLHVKRKRLLKRVSFDWVWY